MLDDYLIRPSLSVTGVTATALSSTNLPVIWLTLVSAYSRTNGLGRAVCLVCVSVPLCVSDF